MDIKLTINGKKTGKIGTAKDQKELDEKLEEAMKKIGKDAVEKLKKQLRESIKKGSFKITL